MDRQLMRIPTESWSSLEDFDVILNGISVGKLFEKYEEIGFIYPAKKELLGPHWPAINQHWKKLVEEGENLFWLLVNKDHGCSENFVSVSFFRQNNHCMMAQHLVSSGNPFLSLKVLLAAQFRAYSNNCSKAGKIELRPGVYRSVEPDQRYRDHLPDSLFGKGTRMNAF